MKKTELLVKVDLGIGKGSSTIWGCDLTKEYIDIIFYGTLIFLILTSLNAVLYAQGDTKTYRNVLILSCLQKECY